MVQNAATQSVRVCESGMRAGIWGDPAVSSRSSRTWWGDQMVQNAGTENVGVCHVCVQSVTLGAVILNSVVWCQNGAQRVCVCVCVRA